MNTIDAYNFGSGRSAKESIIYNQKKRLEIETEIIRLKTKLIQPLLERRAPKTMVNEMISEHEDDLKEIIKEIQDLEKVVEASKKIIK